MTQHSKLTEKGALRNKPHIALAKRLECFLFWPATSDILASKSDVQASEYCIELDKKRDEGIFYIT